MLKAYFRLISSLMKSRGIFESLPENVKLGWNSFCPLHLRYRIFEIFVVLGTIRLKGEENLFKELLEAFYFPSDFIIVAENF